MFTCTFFGHRDCSDEVKILAENTIRKLIVNGYVDCFYVGNQGYFDKMILNILSKLKEEFHYINYNVVLAYIPVNKKEYDTIDYKNAIIPEGIENVPKRFAISHRNRWMVNKSDYVVCYVTRSFGGAAQFVEYAKKRIRLLLIWDKYVSEDYNFKTNVESNI